jgi:hypothetical protein
MMGSFKVLNDKELQDGIFLGFARDEEYVELFVHGHRLIVLKNEVEPVEILN